MTMKKTVCLLKKMSVYWAYYLTFLYLLSLSELGLRDRLILLLIHFMWVIQIKTRTRFSTQRKKLMGLNILSTGILLVWLKVDVISGTILIFLMSLVVYSYPYQTKRMKNLIKSLKQSREMITISVLDCLLDECLYEDDQLFPLQNFELQQLLNQIRYYHPNFIEVIFEIDDLKHFNFRLP